MIRFACSNCNRIIRVDQKHSGKKGKCPKCGGVVVVPESSSIIESTCGTCGHKIRIPTKYAGKKGKCPKCENPTVVPSIEKPPSEAAETFSVACPMCEQMVQVPEALRGQTVECPACGNYVETSSGTLGGSGSPVPPPPDEDLYEEDTEEYDEPKGVDRRIIVGVSAVAAVVMVGLIVLAVALRSSGPRQTERSQDLGGQRQATDTDSQLRPVTHDAQPTEPAQAVPPRKPGDVVTNSIGMKLVYIPAGSFMMGSPPNEGGRGSDEGPQHQVRISEGFWMGQTEITQGQYMSVMNAEPWYEFGGGYVPRDANNPAVYVSWDDAEEFCRKLSQQEGKTYRLPTEAEWEYACRAGTTTRFSFGDSASSLGDYAWFHGNAHEAHRVGQKKPNPWLLYDMHGNVLEWCSHHYPTGPSSGLHRPLRGGSWNHSEGFLRCSCRFWGGPLRRSYVGFRVVRSQS